MAQALDGEGRFKLQSLELGRFIAAMLVMLVMLSHAAPFVNSHAANFAAPMFGGILFPGPLGVQYFFVLSGFVMASSHYRDAGKFSSVPRFWWRRACRIYPTYWLALCIPVFYFYRNLTPGLTLHLLLLDPWCNIEYIPATWSMRYEMAFYIGFSLCLLPYIGRSLLGLWIFITLWHWKLGFLLPFYVPVLTPATFITAHYAGDFFTLFEVYFFAGLAAGYAYAKLRCGWRVWAGVLALGGVLFGILLPMEDWGVLYGSGASFSIVMSLVQATALLGLAGLERCGVFRLGRFAGWLGAMSYPLYIFHEPVMLIIDHDLHWGKFGTAGLYVHFTLLCAGILGLSALVTFLFDQPVQRLLRVKRRGTKPRGLFTPASGGSSWGG